MMVDSYQILQPNPFDIPSYPDKGQVTIAWFYNDINDTWLNKLPGEVRTLLNSQDPTNRLDNFPHFGTVNQNQTDDGLPQFLYYSAQQINLLAHMWSYNIMHEASDQLLALSQSA